jgi:hypothetical protein
MHFRSSTRRCLALQFELIVINGNTDEIFQSTLVNLIALEKIDRSPRVASGPQKEELVLIWEGLACGEKACCTLLSLGRFRLRLFRRKTTGLPSIPR